MTPDISLDSAKWARAEFWTWEEVEYLLVGVDHWKFSHLDPDVEADHKPIQRRKIREALSFHFRHSVTSHRVTPLDAINIVRRAGLRVPDELVQAVEAAASSSHKTIEKLPSEEGAQKKLNKLAKVFWNAPTEVVHLLG